MFICLVHKSKNWISLSSALKIVYKHLPCTVDRGGASILSPGNTSTKEKVCAKHWKNSVPSEGL